MTRTPEDIRNELLVLRCRRNDATAWDELVGLYHDRLFYFVRRLVRDDDQAFSVMQDAWVQILRSLGRLQSADRLLPWLYTVARRSVVNQFRQSFASAESTQPELGNVIDDAADSGLQLENAELIHIGLSRIGLVEREVLTLHFLEAFSVAEIAEILEVPPGTVKSRLSRARAELRRVLEQEAAKSPGGRL